MPSVQRYLSGRDNYTATLAASSVRAGTAVSVCLRAAQAAAGRLAGSYTGHEAAQRSM